MNTMLLSPSAVVALREACRRAWVKSSAELVERYSRHAFDALLASGEIVALARDLYAPRLFSTDIRVRSKAALAACGTGAITGLAGLFFNDVIDEAPHRAMIVIGRHHHVTRRVTGTVHYRASVQPPQWQMHGLDVAEPEWCLLHAMRELHRAKRLDLAITVLASDRVSPHALLEILAERRRAVGRKELLAAVDLHLRGIESPLELRGLRDVLYGPEFAHLTWQVDVIADKTHYRIDAYDDQARVAIEFDGKRNHMRPARVAYDRERDARLATEGIITLRFSFWDVVNRPEWCRAMVLAAIAQRTAAA